MFHSSEKEKQLISSLLCLSHYYLERTKFRSSKNWTLFSSSYNHHHHCFIISLCNLFSFLLRSFLLTWFSSPFPLSLLPCFFSLQLLLFSSSSHFSSSFPPLFYLISLLFFLFRSFFSPSLILFLFSFKCLRDTLQDLHICCRYEFILISFYTYFLLSIYIYLGINIFDKMFERNMTGKPKFGVLLGFNHKSSHTKDSKKGYLMSLCFTLSIIR